jgi:hypothetical protein
MPDASPHCKRVTIELGVDGAWIERLAANDNGANASGARKALVEITIAAAAAMHSRLCHRAADAGR